MLHTQFVRISFYVILFIVFSFAGNAQTTGYWQESRSKHFINPETRSSFPVSYRSLKLDLSALKAVLNNAILEDLPNAYSGGPVVSLPLPNGSFGKFRVALSPLVPDGMAMTYPMIRAFTAQGIDDPHAVAKLDYTIHGFHAMIMSPEGWVFIDPVSYGNTTDYISYYREGSQRTHAFVCETLGRLDRVAPQPQRSGILRTSGATLKTYRLAVACTGEYTTFHGGTKASALSAIVTSVNRVNGVYEIENAVRMVLIPNDSLLVYTNPSTDPYSNSNGSTMLGQNQTNIDAVIGTANYDIGHVFSTGGGGVAYLGSVCNSGNKAGGVTGSGSPVGDAFDIDYVAHEIGHQFGGNHTFNSTTGSCSGNRNASTAYEPGSGTTIMAYAGICGAHNIQPNSDPIFHTGSYDEIQIFITTGGGNNCDVATSTGNSPPVVPVGTNYTIPISTPFILTGSATDPNGDPMTYIWEQYDIGPAGAPNSPTLNAPLFRDWEPVTSLSRVFPRMEDLVRNQQTLGEILPSYARSMKFRFTARDNRAGGGGVTYNDTPVTLTVTNTATPFSVTSPNTAVTWFGNTSQTVTWNVSSTDIAPINCANVNILLSIDSGYTYPYTLATNTPNDGSHSITVPNVVTTKARVKVESVGNIFFDISNVNFTISSSSSSLSVITTSPVSPLNICAGSSVSVEFTTDGPANAGNVFTAQLSSSTGSFASPVTIGTLSSVNAGTINAVIPGGTAAGSGYRIRVVSSNPAVTGSNNGTNITISQPAGGPGAISGLASVCQGQTGVVYTVPSINNATGYNWTLPSGASITAGSNTNSITVSYSSSAASGAITVQGTNAGCGNGSTSSPYNVNVSNLPSAAGSISGSSTVCQGQSSVAYSIAAIPGVSGYNWTMPSGASISAGANTNSVTVNFSASAVSGSITAAGVNACGTGASSSFSVSVLPVPAAPIITAGGPTAICSGGSVDLSYSQSGGNLYQWRKDGLEISGETGSLYTATTTGSYDVIAASPLTFTNSDIISIPDFVSGSCLSGSSTISISGYTGAVASSGISIQFNITHTYVGDLVIVLQAPNNSILGISNKRGGSGDNFVNTIISDAGAAVIPTSGAPYTGIYKPVAATFSESTCVTTTVTSFGAIGGGTINPNGNWILKVFDRAGADIGTIDNWSITIPATVDAPCVSVSNAIAVTSGNTGNASVSILSGSGTTICAGTNVTFTATPVNGGTTPSYQWKRNGTNVGANSNTFSTTSLSNGDVITCVMTSSDPCVNGSPATSNSVTMTVIASVSASVSVSANPGNNICSGTNVTFTASPVNGGSTPSYQWKIGGTNVGTNNAIFSTSSLANGNVVTCVMTSSANCVTGSPATSNAITMTVSPTVTASISISANPGNNVCSGTSVTFTATPVNGGASPSYQWKRNGSTNVGINSSTYTTSSLNNGDVITCVMTSNANCVTGSPATSNGITMTINPAVSAGLSITATDDTICAGTSVTFTAIPVNGGSAPSYQWKKNGSTNVGTNSSTYSTTTLVDGDIITCVMTSNAPCVSGNPATSNAIKMKVDPVVAASVSISANPGNSICSGTSVTFTATPVNGGTAPGYQWKIGAVNVGTNSATYTSSSLNNGQSITCVVTSNASCATGSPATSNAIVMSVTPNVTAGVSISANPGNTICSGSSVTFTATPTNGGSTPSYQWKIGTTNVGTNSSAFTSSSLSNGNVVSCVMTSSLSCVTGSPSTSNLIGMTVNGNPSISGFSPAGGGAGTVVTISGSGFTGANAVAFNGASASFVVNSDAQITATVPSSPTNGVITVSTPCSSSNSANSFIVISNVTLNLKVLIEGFYLGGGQMASIIGPGLCDTVEVCLAGSASPNSIQYCVKSVIDVMGNGSFVFPGQFFGSSYYLVIRHRNALQTWSSSPVSFGSTSISYDFTTAASKAYGNNQENFGGVYAIHNGDVNQDGSIDGADVISLENAISLFQTGYIVFDLTGDGAAESSDYSIIENNVSRSVLRP